MILRDDRTTCVSEILGGSLMFRFVNTQSHEHTHNDMKKLDEYVYYLWHFNEWRLLCKLYIKITNFIYQIQFID